MSFRATQQHPRYRISIPVAVVLATGDVEELPLENISLGGAFIKTTKPQPRGSVVRLNLATMGLLGRVVHVIDENASVDKSHPPGMGVQFDGLTSEAKGSLQRFVDKLLEAERRARPRRAVARFVHPTRVEIVAERTVVARAWAAGLSSGELAAEGETRIGSRIVVVIGPMQLAADVVHVDKGIGAKLRIIDLTGTKRDTLERFVDGTVPDLAVDVVRAGPSLAKVLGAARQLFRGIAEKSAFSALGLATTATADEVSARTQELLSLFSAEHETATPAQLGRIEAAMCALAALEPLHVVDVRDQVVELIAEADFLESAGRREEARIALADALEMAPDDVDVQYRLAAIDMRAPRH